MFFELAMSVNILRRIRNQLLESGRFLANRRRVAKKLSVGADPFEPKVQSKLMRKPDATMNFGRGSRHEFTDLAQVRLGVTSGQASFGGDRVKSMRGVPNHRTARLKISSHLGAHVLHRLE